MSGKQNGSVDILNRAHAAKLDVEDSLGYLREEFIIPTKADLQRKRLPELTDETAHDPCIYFCGNSLGLQPRRTAHRVSEHLSAWASKGVTGHFAEHGSNLPPFLRVDH